MALTGNPIELLMTLGIDSNKSKSNVDSQVQALKKYYDRNPLLISLGVNKGNLEKELNNLKSIISKEKANLDIVLNVSRGSKNTFGEMNKEIEALHSKVVKLEQELKKAMSIPSKFKTDEGMADAFEKQKIALMRLNTELVRTEKAYLRTMDKSKVSEFRNEIERLSNLGVINPANLKNNQRDIDILREKIRLLNVESRHAARSSNELGNAFSNAFSKFSLWLGVGTAIYAPIRAIQDMTQRVIELDSALIGLARVMNAPEYQFNEMIEKSLVNVRELSGVTTEYLELLNEFARMGYNASDSLDMSNTAQIFTNISDLNAKESVNTLVSGMLAFNIAAEDSVKIADALNEVDNNFSITTKDLALSMNKAAQSAKTYGVSMEELVGYTTAIGSATRE